MKAYVGLDVHSRSSVFVIQNEPGEELGWSEVPTSAEESAARRARYGLRASTAVALESGTMAFFAVRRLGELGFSPVVVDAREVRMKAHRPRLNSDTRDAAELCEGVRRDVYRAMVHTPGEGIEHLRNTFSRRRHFVRLGTAEINAAKKMLRRAGLLELSRQHLGALPPISARHFSRPEWAQKGWLSWWSFLGRRMVGESCWESRRGCSAGPSGPGSGSSAASSSIRSVSTTSAASPSRTGHSRSGTSRSPSAARSEAHLR